MPEALLLDWPLQTALACLRVASPSSEAVRRPFHGCPIAVIAMEKYSPDTLPHNALGSQRNLFKCDDSQPACDDLLTWLALTLPP
jgi:hypothetical protein